MGLGQSKRSYSPSKEGSAVTLKNSTPVTTTSKTPKSHDTPEAAATSKTPNSPDTPAVVDDIVNNMVSLTLKESQKEQSEVSFVFICILNLVLLGLGFTSKCRILITGI